MDVILKGNNLQHLYYLLEFLAAWKKRPVCLTLMAYQWCSAISEVVWRSGRREIYVIQPRLPWRELELRVELHRPWLRFHQLHLKPGLGLRLRLRQQDLAFGEGPKFHSSTAEGEFSQVGPGCDPLRLGETFHHTRRGPLEDLTPLDYAHLLSVALEIGFRLATPSRDRPALHLNHTPHHDWIFGTAFSSHDDEVVADAVCAWIADGDCTPPGSCVRYFTKRVERDVPFSPRLRRVSIRAIERIWRGELKVLVLETVRLLNRLDVDVDDMVEKHKWGGLLAGIINSPVGSESLSSHYWRLLDQLVLFATLDMGFEPRGAVMRSLEEAEDWEKLETWMVVAWRSQWAGSTEDIGRTTLELLSRWPSALPRFEDLCKMGILRRDQEVELRQICNQARTKLSPSESSPP